MEILIAEDSTTMRLQLEMYLTDMGYGVVSCKDGLEAWEEAQSEYAPNLLILDWMMPGMDGVDLSRKIRELNKTSYVYIIILTTKEDKNSIIEGLEAGADDYMVKPFSPEELGVRIKTGIRIVELYKDLNQRNEELKNETNELKQAEEQIKASLEEKELLLKEIHHRVKNNMQVISSLLRLQAKGFKDKNIIEAFEESQNRIKVMSLIHEKLYQSKDIANINFGEYIKDLANALFRSYKVSVARVALKMDLSDITINIDSVIPCGLIVNEFISNSLKYAFPEDKEGEIKISLRLLDKGEIGLIISDNGIGLPKDMDYRNTESLGLRLIVNLTEHQLRGKIELNRDKGTEFRIKFKIKKTK